MEHNLHKEKITKQEAKKCADFFNAFTSVKAYAYEDIAGEYFVYLDIDGCYDVELSTEEIKERAGQYDELSLQTEEEV